MRSERGQTAPEYLGALLLVGAIVVALVQTSVGETLRTEISRVVCEIAGRDDCGERITAVDPECLVSSETRDASFSVNIVAVRIGTGATLIKQVFADGRTVFTLVDDAEVAAELIAGVRARAGTIGFNAAAALSAGGRLTGARVYEFTDPDDAADFEEKVRDEGTIEDLLHQAIELGDNFSPLSPIVDVGDEIADFIFGEDADDLPAPTATYVEAEAFVGGDASIGAGIPGLDGELEAAVEGAGGAKVYTSGPKAGQVELNFEVTADVAADLGLLTLGPGISGDTRVTATLVLAPGGDGEFRPRSLRVVGTAGYNGSPLQSSEVLAESDLAELNSSLERVGAHAREGTGQQIEFAAALDLEDPRNLRAALGLLNPAGRPRAAAELVERFAEDGTLTLQVYDTSSSESGVELKGGLGANAGFGAEESADGRDLAGAWVREPGGAWVQRRCGAPGDPA